MGHRLTKAIKIDRQRFHFSQHELTLFFSNYTINKQKPADITSPLAKARDTGYNIHRTCLLSVGRSRTRQMPALIIIQEAQHKNKLCTGDFYSARCGRRLFRTDI